MKIVTLTSDFGLKDYYVGAVKGRLYSQIPEVTVVDISHSISSYNILEASYVVQRVYNNFPKGTIHIISVDTELTQANKYMAIELDGHFFIGTDNGIFSKIAEEIKPTQIYKIEAQKTTFPTLDVFVNVASHIANGLPLNDIGVLVQGMNSYSSLSLDCTENDIKGKIVYIDHYGNLITNISKSVFETVSKNRVFEIKYKGYRFSIIHNSYNEIAINGASEEYEGKSLAVFNSEEMLELTVYRGQPHNGAISLLGASHGESVLISFKD